MHRRSNPGKAQSEIQQYKSGLEVTAFALISGPVPTGSLGEVAEITWDNGFKMLFFKERGQDTQNTLLYSGTICTGSDLLLGKKEK